MESWGKQNNRDQRLSLRQMRRQWYNYSSSKLFLYFPLPLIISCKWLPYGISLMCMCVHMRGSKNSSENPIKGDIYWFAVLVKAFWDISTDISFNVRANGKKQTNLLVHFLFLFPLFYLFSSLSVIPHQYLSHAPPSLHLAMHCKNQHFPKLSFFLSFSSLGIIKVGGKVGGKVASNNLISKKSVYSIEQNIDIDIVQY